MHCLHCHLKVDYKLLFAKHLIVVVIMKHNFGALFRSHPGSILLRMKLTDQHDNKVTSSEKAIHYFGSQSRSEANDREELKPVEKKLGERKQKQLQQI